MRADTAIQNDVEAELRWSPQLDEKDVAVKVTNAVVALTGYVHSYYDKRQAEAAAKRVKGVAAVANDIEVRLGSSDGLSDPEIARNAAAAIQFQVPAAKDGVKAIVANGRVTLEGEVPWHYQREAIESAVVRMQGVVSVNNQLRVKPRAAPAQIKARIEEAFRRSAEVDAHQVSVAADGGDVILSGRVKSWSERDEAQRTAWAAPGVTKVINNITVGG